MRTPKGPLQRIVCSREDLRPKPSDQSGQLARKVDAALVGQLEFDAQRDSEIDKLVRRVRQRRDLLTATERERAAVAEATR